MALDIALRNPGSGFNLSLSTESGGSSSLLDGLLAYYKLDESSGNAIDATGNGHTGTVSGATQGASGKINSGYSFDGENDVVDLGAIGLGTNAGSISAWVKAGTTSDYVAVIGRYYNQHAIIIRNSGYWSAVWNNTVVYGSVAVETTSWHHIVVTYDGSLGSNNLKIYVDGNLAGQEDLTGNITNQEEAWGLGSDTNGSSWWGGGIDEVGFYDRALTSEEVTSLSAAPEYPFNTFTPVEASGTASCGSTANATATCICGLTASTVTASSLSSGVATVKNVLTISAVNCGSTVSATAIVICVLASSAIVGSSSVTGTPRLIISVTSLANGCLSTVSGTVITKLSISSTNNNASSTTAAQLVAQGILGAISSGSSTVIGTVVCRCVLAGSVTGNSNTLATGFKRIVISANSGGVSSVIGGAVALCVATTTAITGSSAAVGNLIVRKFIAITSVAGSSGVVGAVVSRCLLSAGVVTSTDLYATAIARCVLSSSVTGGSSTNALLALRADDKLVGSCATGSQVSGTLKAVCNLVGSAAAGSVVQQVTEVKVLLAISAAVQSSATIGIDVGNIVSIGGTAACVSDFNISIGLLEQVSVDALSASQAEADVEALLSIDSNLPGTSQTSLSLTYLSQIVSEIISGTTTSSSLTWFSDVNGNCIGESSSSLQLQLLTDVTGEILCTTDVEASLEIPTSITTIVFGVGAVTADITNLAGITVGVNSHGELSSNLGYLAGITSSANCSSTITPDIYLPSIRITVPNSLLSVDRSCIFRQVFSNGEYDIVNNPYVRGIASNITFNNNSAIFNGSNSNIIYQGKQFNGTYSVRIRFTNKDKATYRWLINFYNVRSGQIGYIGMNSSDIPSYSNGLIYINGITQLPTILDNTEYDLIITGITLKGDKFNIGTAGVSEFFYGSIYSVEIYNRVLTASEVSLLYNNSLYRTDVIKKPIAFLSGSAGFIEEKTGKSVSVYGAPVVVKQPNSCIHIKSIGQSIYCDHPIVLNTTTPASFSFCGWVKTSKGSQNKLVCSAATDGTGTGFGRFVFDSGGRAYVQLKNGTTAHYSNVLKTEKWMLVAMTFDGSRINGYVNGSTTWGGSVNSTDKNGTGYYNRFSIGLPNSTFTNLGFYNDFRLFDSVLTVDQITNIYNSEKSLYGL